MNMMRKNNNRDNRGGGNRNNRGGSGGGARRYSNNSGGGNRSGGANDGQNLQRQKHHATQQLGKYGDLARNAQINGDRVDVEYYLQHVDHYTRVLADIASIEADRHASQRESQIIPGGPNDPNAQAQGTGEQSGGEGAASDATSGGSANDGAGSSEFSPNNQPRMTREPRRQRYENPEPSSDNGAREANSNATEIPLPGGILPPI